MTTGTTGACDTIDRRLRYHVSMPEDAALTDLFGALSDPRRRAILELLRQGSVTAGRIAEEFSVSRPAISRHLRVLREAGLVCEERDGRRWIYRLSPSRVELAARYLQAFQAPAARTPAASIAAGDDWRCW